MAKSKREAEPDFREEPGPETGIRASPAGDEFVHKSVGKARAKGELDVLRPGDPGYGAKASSELPQPKGLRVEVAKHHQHSEDHDPEDLYRVIAPHPNKETHPTGEVVLFSGNKKQFSQLKKAVQKDPE